MKLKYLFYLITLLTPFVTFAQGDVATSDIFRSNLKYYVVAAVLTIIMSCIFGFLWFIERRVEKLERSSK